MLRATSERLPAAVASEKEKLPAAAGDECEREKRDHRRKRERER